MMGELAIFRASERPDTSELEVQRHTMLTKATALKIDDPVTMQAATEFLRDMRRWRKDYEDRWDTARRNAVATHKTIMATIKEETEPVKEAEAIVQEKRTAYKAIEEEARKKEEARLAEVARKHQEELTLAEASRLEAEGRKAEADQLLNEPIVAPPPVVPSRIPKTEGVSDTTRWKHRVINAAMIPPEYQMPDNSKIAAYARSMKGLATMPGVEFFPVDSVSIRRTP